jgi:hypothetical protein
MSQTGKLSEILQSEDKYSTVFSKEQKGRSLDKIDILRDFLTYKLWSNSNPVEEIIKEKIRFHRASLVQILNLIMEREKAKQNNLVSIESEALKVQGELFLYKCIVYPISPDNKRKSNFERAVSELEKQKRQEEIDCWKDTLKLWQQLLDIIAEYRATMRKARLLLFTK